MLADLQACLKRGRLSSLSHLAYALLPDELLSLLKKIIAPSLRQRGVQLYKTCAKIDEYDFTRLNRAIIGSGVPPLVELPPKWYSCTRRHFCIALFPTRVPRRLTISMYL
jgi:hypothetical protein